MGVFAGLALCSTWGCSPAAEEAVTVETIVDAADAPVETLEIEEAPISRSVDDVGVDDDERVTDPGDPEPDASTSADVSTTDPPTGEPAGGVDDGEPSNDTPTTTVPSVTTPPIDPPVAAPVPSADVAGRASGPVISVSASDLVGVAGQTAELAAECDEDMPCAGQPPPPRGGGRGDVSVGEYQRNVFVPQDAELDIYFDQSRSIDDMNRICDELGGYLATRSQDGSRWAGWHYCHGVDY